jgi:hypothetical protein
MSNRKQLDVLMNQVEEMWSHQDTLLTIIDDTNSWAQRHGSEWTFADVPYHLAYCNHDLVYLPIKLGRDLPSEERLAIASVEELHAWNDRKFTERPDGQTGQEALAQLRATWEDIRQITSEMTDQDLERPYWLAFMGGNWLTVRHGLLWTLSHDWSEFMQLRIHMGRSQPVPSPEITTHYLGSLIGNVFPFFLDKDAAKGREFTTVMAFTDPSVSGFSIRVQDGAAMVTPGRSEEADLVMTQSAETFEKTMRGIQSMHDALQSGAIEVNNFDNLATFGELFPISM